MFRSIVDRLPRSAGIEHLEAALDEMSLLREEIVNQLENQTKTQKATQKSLNLSAIYRIQIPNPLMYLNQLPKRSRGQSRANALARQGM
jgi:replication initiation protein RepC